MRHNNLFGWVDDTKGFYEKLQADFKRDDRKIEIASLILLAPIFYLARNLEGLDYAAVIALAICVHVLFFSYIDHSNRNFMMHMIDWHLARERELKEQERDAEFARNRDYWKQRELGDEDV